MGADLCTRRVRFHVDDPELALTLAAGALLSLNRLLHDQPERDDAQATDRLVENLLRVTACPPTKPRKSAVGRFRTWITSPFTMSSQSKGANPSHAPGLRDDIPNPADRVSMR